MKRGKRELRTGGSIVDFCKKKIVQEREDWECPLSSKNNKKGIFRRTFSPPQSLI